MQTLLDTLIRLSRRWIGSSRQQQAQAKVVQELAPGSRWGQFRIVCKLGEGAFGTVYHAQDAIDRDVALKLLNGSEAIAEGKVLSQLKHPSIVGVLSYEQSAEGAALAMEFIHGQSLEQYVAANGSLDPIHAALIGSSLCQALAMVHRKELLHRDIKASNVMRQPDGRIVLIDFGLGQKIEGEAGEAEIAGTLPYMAPELFDGAPASVTTDIYAVGVLLFYLVSQQYPTTAGSYTAFQEEHRSRARRHLIDIRPDLPPEFIAVVETAINPDSARRFRSAGAMNAALENVLRIRPKKPAWRLKAVIAALLISVVLLAALFWPRTKADRRAPPGTAQYVRITKGDGLSQDPTLSADGMELVYASDEAEPGNLDLWVSRLPDGSPIRLTTHHGIDWMPAVSPDGRTIVFRSERDGGGIYSISAWGNGQEKLIARGGYAPRISPDGYYIAYYTGELWHPKVPSAKLYIVPVTGGIPRQVCPQMADARNPVWAPDSRHLLFQGSPERNVPPDLDAEWWITGLDCTAPQNTGVLESFDKQQDLEAHTWSVFWKDDSLIFSAAQKTNINLWRAPISPQPPYKIGTPERLTSGAAVETSPWPADDGSIAYASQTENLRIWSLPLEPGEPPDKDKLDRVTATTDYDAFPSISRDEKWMAFTRTVSETGLREIWLKDLQTSKEIQTTKDSQPGINKENPMISPNGDLIAYSVIQKRGADDIYVLSISSGSKRLLCSGCGTVTGWSKDGQSLLAAADGRIQIVGLASGRASARLQRAGFYLDEAETSPDGRWIAFSALPENGDRKVYLVRGDGSGEWISVGPAGSEKPHWSADGRTLYFYSNQDSFLCLHQHGFDTASGRLVGPLRPVRHFHNVRMSPIHISEPVRGFAVTAHRIYCNLPEVLGSIWMRVPKK
jgi:Tol biopolymer transport system component